MDVNTKILPFPRSYWVIPGKLLAGHIPTNKDPKICQEKLENLIKLGIRAFVNLQEENEVDFESHPFHHYEDDLKKLENKYQTKIEFNRRSIKDYSIPTKEKMTTILDTIDSYIDNGIPVYVHCWGGIGRTGTVISCYLLRHNMANTDNVFDMIEYLRRSDPENHRQSPETPEQFDFVRNWDKNL